MAFSEIEFEDGYGVHGGVARGPQAHGPGDDSASIRENGRAYRARRNASGNCGELIARAAMLAAIAESRPFKRFLGLFCCSMRCAVACESIPQLLIGFEESSASCVRDAGQAN